MPYDYKEYPENWKWISEQTIKDAGNKCELCYASNGIYIWRPIKGFVTSRPWYLYDEISGSTERLRQIKIVLTVHHIDGDKKNISKQNLIALCQKCHLRLDLGKHMKNRTKTKALPIFF
jgi:hypothetical protein